MGQSSMQPLVHFLCSTCWMLLPFAYTCMCDNIMSAPLMRSFFGILGTRCQLMESRVVRVPRLVLGFFWR